MKMTRPKPGCHRLQREIRLSDWMAERYDSLVASYQHIFRACGEALRACLDETSAIIDIGCGTGNLALDCADSASRIVGVDASPRMIEVARRKAQALGRTNVQFMVRDAYDLPFDEGCFDVVLLSNVLHILESPWAMLREALRVLKRGGKLVVMTDCYAEPITSPIFCLQSLAYRLLRAARMAYINSFRREDVDRLVRNAGFTISSSRVVNEQPLCYLVLGEKVAAGAAASEGQT